MNTTTLDFNTLTLLVAIMGSTLTTVILMFRQSNHLNRKLDKLDAKFDTKIDALDAKFDTKIDALDAKFTERIDAFDAKFTERIDAFDAKFTGKFDALGRDVTEICERLERVEGHLMGPESFAPRLRRQPERDDPPSDHRAPG